MDEYVIFNMFIFGVNDNGLIKVKIMWEVHVINNLKAKMLVSIDIIRFKKINIIILIKQVYIEFYKIIIFIKIQPYLSQQIC